MSIEPAAWLARDFGTDPATGLNGVTVAILGRTRLSADADEAAVRAVLDLATHGSAWRALQLQDPMNITILTAMRNAAAALQPATAPDILVSAVLNQVRLAMFPGRRATTGSPPIVATDSYLSQWCKLTSGAAANVSLTFRRLGEGPALAGTRPPRTQTWEVNQALRQTTELPCREGGLARCPGHASSLNSRTLQPARPDRTQAQPTARAKNVATGRIQVNFRC